MDTLFAMEAQQNMEFGQSLCEEFKPLRIADFVGLEKNKRVLAAFLKNPKPLAMLFCGISGSGKTTMAQAVARELSATVWHIGSQECKVERLQETISHCHYVPKAGLKGFHVVVVDEADVMSDAAQKFLLSKLDGTSPVPATIFIFTCNCTERLEERFLSRCAIKLDFNSYGAALEISALLERIWKAKAPADAPMPNLKRLAIGNIRESISRLETELYAVAG